MDIDRSAPAIAEGEILIAAPSETVWEVIADVVAWPSWNPDVKSMKVEGPVRPVRRSAGSGFVIPRFDAEGG